MDELRGSLQLVLKIKLYLIFIPLFEMNKLVKVNKENKSGK